MFTTQFEFDPFEFYTVTFEMYIEDKLVNKQQMQAPDKILIMQFLNAAQELAEDSRPIKIRMITPTVIWDEFNKKERVLENGLEFMNRAMESYERNKKY